MGSILTIALIGLAQITAGVFLAACTLGTGLMLAKGLISEEISDLITAVKAGIQGGFSWAEWGLQKAISLAVSLICAGWDAIKKGFTAVKETAQNRGSATTVLGKQGMKVAMQRVGLELGKRVAKDCVNALVNYGVDQLIVKNIEEEIAKKVTEKVSRFLEQNTLAQAALALDLKNENNHWQNLLLQEGLALLAVEKYNTEVYSQLLTNQGVLRPSHARSLRMAREKYTAYKKQHERLKGISGLTQTISKERKKLEKQLLYWSTKQKFLNSYYDGAQSTEEHVYTVNFNYEHYHISGVCTYQPHIVGAYINYVFHDWARGLLYDTWRRM